MSNQKKSKVTGRSLYYWVFAGNGKLQVVLGVVILLVVVARVLPLEMQKRIINESIALRQFDNLLVYCLIYLASVASASGLKLVINYLQSLIGEQAIMNMRRELYHHILTLPLSFFRRTQPGMVVSSLMTELSTAGTFTGMALAVPATNILTLLALGGYLLWLNTRLALATMLIYPFIVFLLPILQKKANTANAERVDLSRRLSSQITESVTGIHEVQVHGAYQRENSRFDSLAETLRKIRIRWSLLRFGIKTANNFFVSLGPFIVFIFGGYLVMMGQLELGAMVAFLSAQEKLYDPWKELIDFYQIYQDAKVRYSRTMTHFSAEPEFDPNEYKGESPKLVGNIEVKNLVFETREGVRLLRGVHFSLTSGEHMALVGFSGSGKSTLAQCLAKMYQYNAGTVTIDGHDLNEMTKTDVVTNVGYITQSPFVFTGTIMENLVYAEQASHDLEQCSSTREKYVQPPLDRLILSLQQAGLFVDVMRFGLESHIDINDRVMAEKIIRIRKNFRLNFGEQLADYVEFYREDSYLDHSTVGDNLLFGAAEDRSITVETLLENKQFLVYLKEQNLVQPLLTLGVELCQQTIDVLRGIGKDEFFFRFSPVPAARLDECSALLVRLQNKGMKGLPDTDKQLLLLLALKFIPAVHKTGSLDAGLKTAVLEARRSCQVWLDTHYTGGFTDYDESEYIFGESILNNIFFGRARSDLPHAQEKINQAIVHLLIEEDCLEEIAARGMEFEVGSMGDNLSGGQRQKLAIARALLKEPPILIMDEATSALDNKSQARIQRLMEQRWKGKRTIISIVHRLDNIDTFDKIGVMKSGKMMEFGTYQELMDRKGGLYELVTGKR
ncbi:ABC transporter ATP-binding protein/permease [Desulfopila sp. IMCC35008]|uniref:ABC transporter ATP-binding protein/permease n=1 Tax=Desulfopila sp. IMCC35008 TaxID=2653858 RepID=UPI0013D865FC|nr:ABC transporter ATP-binding protein/permease [Desulfopila sp. IMCC35008]